ncbi:HAD family hydrolase [Coraliomargarita sp. SDUM461003]|uniref:HAD family hydrolase n=2 Tax=Thalassobacterium TaxID=3410851 RepID=A0ABU1B0X5_9BACT|nr:MULTISPECIES: HAD family hydrolase [unclassified Coraliomargarita]MDQ8194494.1 HAD family hydrolase [Coraliomargarita sp. SDUM461004]MDQ8208987.1 HAD family hydrolase [Coraliomargarita sp. SDUM461003]
MNEVRYLFFDVGGTVFDWKSTAKRTIEDAASQLNEAVDSEAFASDWRRTMFDLVGEVRRGNRHWLTADQMHELALESMTGRFPVLRRLDLAALTRMTWHQLDVFEGAADMVARLRTRYTVLVLTILNYQSIIESSKRGGVIWDGIFSCELLGHYKPSLQSYRKALRLMGVSPGDACMVAAHKGDLAAASQVGMRTAYVSAPIADHVGSGFGDSEGVTFDIEVDSYEALCQSFEV